MFEKIRDLANQQAYELDKVMRECMSYFDIQESEISDRFSVVKTGFQYDREEDMYFVDDKKAFSIITDKSINTNGDYTINTSIIKWWEDVK